jgi:hypothetical protein
MKKFNLLSRAEMKKVMGGMDAMLEEVGGGGCRVAIRDSDGSWRGWSHANYSVGSSRCL